MRTHKAGGFTLIELVIVITIIGILAAFAIPRYTELQGNARMAKMNGALGAIKSAAAMAHAQLLTNQYSATYTGNSTTGTPSFTIEGIAVDYVNGYPKASIIADLAGISSPDYDTPVVTGTKVTIAADSQHAACNVAYTESAGVGAPPTYDSITGLTIANCQ